MSPIAVAGALSAPPPLTLGTRTLSFERPVLMGIINATPDSFSDGGTLDSVDDAVRRAEVQVEAGALILDVGGESTRPGARGVDAATERRRVVGIVNALVLQELPAVVSIDTAKAEVARAALEHGATLVNDVTALGDPEMADVVKACGAGLILMHMRGEPRTMQMGEIVYDDLVADVRRFLADGIERAVTLGVARERLFVDPGIGFGKTVAHNLTLTRAVGDIATLGRPVVYGPSRKRFLGEVTGRAVDDRDRATAAACVAAVLNGAHVLRVHNVAAVKDAILVATALRDAP